MAAVDFLTLTIFQSFSFFIQVYSTRNSRSSRSKFLGQRVFSFSAPCTSNVDLSPSRSQIPDPGSRIPDPPSISTFPSVQSKRYWRPSQLLGQQRDNIPHSEYIFHPIQNTFLSWYERSAEKNNLSCVAGTARSMGNSCWHGHIMYQPLNRKSRCNYGFLQSFCSSWCLRGWYWPFFRNAVIRRGTMVRQFFLCNVRCSWITVSRSNDEIYEKTDLNTLPTVVTQIQQRLFRWRCGQSR